MWPKVMPERQQQSNTCGPAALSYLLRLFGYRVSEARLVKLMGRERVTVTGVSLRALAEVAERVGMPCRAVTASVEQLKAAGGPALVHMHTQHFVVLLGWQGDMVLIYDPALGEVILHEIEFAASYSGYGLLPPETATVQEATGLVSELPGPGPGPIRRASYYLRPYTMWLLAVVILMLAMNTLGLALPVLMGQLVNVITQQDHGAMEVVQRIVLGLVGAIVAQGAAYSIGSYMFQSIAQAVLFDFRMDYIRRVVVLSTENFQGLSTGDLMSRLTSDLPILQDFLTGLFNIAMHIVTLVVLVIIAFIVAPDLAGLGLSSLPIFAALYLWFFARIRRYTEKVQQLNAEMLGTADRIFHGLDTIKVFVRERLEVSQFSWRQIDLWRTIIGAEKLQQIVNFSAAITGSIGPVLVLWIGGRQVAEGQLSMGMFVAMMFIVSRVYGPIVALAQVNVRWQLAHSAAERFFDIVDRVPVGYEPDSFGSVPTSSGELMFSGVTYEYQSGFGIKDASFSLPPGGMLVVLGPNGAGKSTLLNLIIRNLNPEEGAVYLDGQDIRRLNVSSLRAHIGLVTSNPMIFDGTILDNIRYGRLYAKEEEVITAARAVGLHDHVINLPQGYTTKLTRQGFSLSGGQRQKLALARVILKQPRLIIFDEATSNLDVHAEAQILASLKEACPGSTVIWVTHRPWVAMRADLVAYVDKGRVIDVGSHQKLLKRCEPYRNMMKVALPMGGRG